MINYFRIGIITTTFGIKGEVKVISTTDDIQRFKSLKHIYIINKEEYHSLEENDDLYNREILDIKLLNDKVVLKIKDIDSIDAAQKLINKEIYVKRDDATPLIQDEYYVADIIDKQLILDNKIIGMVKDIMFTGSNANLITMYNNKEILIPMIKDFVDNIDLENNKIYLKTIDGLTDL